MSRLEPGTPAPEFTLPDQDGNQVSLADFRGRQVLVYFYPKDDTPGCTKEACQFNDNLSGFQRAGVPVVGISPDDPDSHQSFSAKYGLQFPLLADVGHQVAEAYGVWGEVTIQGKPFPAVLRSTFLIDEEGRIGRAWYSVQADGHAAQVLSELGA